MKRTPGVPAKRTARHEARRIRRAEAAARLVARSKRSDKEQMKRLVATGHSHCKEYKRLEARVK